MKAGAIAGVGFRRPNGEIETVGCDALILACNGFGGNREMVAQFIPEMADAEYCGHTSNTGDAVDWGTALGADLADMGSYQGHGSVAYPHGLPLTWAVMTQGGFQVNLDGERFADEMRGYSEHAQEVIKQPGHLAWNIYDERCEKPALGFHDYREIVKLGAVKRAETIDELAAVTDLPSQALQRTFEDVAALRRGREARSSRSRFHASSRRWPAVSRRKNQRRAVPYARRAGHRCAGACAAADGTPLPNLFAGGGAARGLSGPSSWGYMSGNGLLSATVLGRSGRPFGGALIAAQS